MTPPLRVCRRQRTPLRRGGAWLAGLARSAGCAGVALALAAAGCAADPLARGEARYRDGDLAGAVGLWRTVPPGSPAHREAQARITRATAFAARLVAERLAQAEAYRAESRFAEAIRMYREALALEPAQPDVVARLNGLARRLAREKAAGHGRVAARLAAGDFAAAYDELVVLKILDPLDTDVLEQLEALEPARAAQARRLLDEARGLASRGQLAAARASAARALDYDPLAPEAEALLADIARRQWAGSEAADAAEPRAAGRRAAGGSLAAGGRTSGIAAGPAAALRRGLALKEAGQPIEALRELARAAEASPRDGQLAAALLTLRGVLQSRVEQFFVQGIRYYRAERMQPAIEQWETVLLIDPGHEKARLYIDKARKVLEKLEAIRREEAAAAVAAPVPEK